MFRDSILNFLMNLRKHRECFSLVGEGKALFIFRMLHSETAFIPSLTYATALTVNLNMRAIDTIHLFYY